MDEKRKIHLLINGRQYPMTIPVEMEEFYRAAARQINNRLNTYRTRFEEMTELEYMEMVLLDLSCENLKLKGRNDTAPFTEKLSELSRELEAYIKPEGDAEESV